VWQWAQASHTLSRDGVGIDSTGYSGSGEGKNNPALQGVPDVGPIPRGLYAIGPLEWTTGAGPHGPDVLRLTPAPGNDMHGRAGFLIHGDAIEHPGAASRGCIVLPRSTRWRIAASGDRELLVIA
jgi:Protein of unknown function (DUF2778)